MYWILFGFTLLLVGLFAGFETALISSNKLSIHLKKKQGKSSGVTISRFLQNPSQFLANCLVGYIFALTAYTLVSSRVLDGLWTYTGISQIDQTGILRLMAEVLLATSIILCTEFVFRALFKSRNVSLLNLFSDIIQFSFRFLEPISNGIFAASNWITKYIFNVRIEDPKKPFSRIDLEHYYQQTKINEEESIDLNKELFENALSISGNKIRSCLVPRKEIVAIEKSTPIREAVQKMIDTRLSRLVVYENSIDNIVGYIHQLDTFSKPSSIHDILLPIPAVPETMPVIDLINLFAKERKSIAWVVDEFGGTAGIITMEDLLEEIFGEIRDEYDIDEFVDKQIAENQYLFSGRLNIDYLMEQYGLVFDGMPSETLSGYIIRNYDDIPRHNERIVINNYQFQILNVSDTRIELVKLIVLN